MQKQDIRRSFEDLRARAGVKAGLVFGEMNSPEVIFANLLDKMTSRLSVCVSPEYAAKLDGAQLQGLLAYKLGRLSHFQKNLIDMLAKPVKRVSSYTAAENVAHELITDKKLCGEDLVRALDERAKAETTDYEESRALWEYGRVFAADAFAAKLGQRPGLVSLLSNARLNRVYLARHPSTSLRIRHLGLING
ncbi:MAG: hypothetical protein AB7G06_04050 [Bdellovibrionales bacterium]